MLPRWTGDRSWPVPPPINSGKDLSCLFPVFVGGYFCIFSHTYLRRFGFWVLVCVHFFLFHVWKARNRDGTPALAAEKILSRKATGRFGNSVDSSVAWQQMTSAMQ